MEISPLINPNNIDSKEEQQFLWYLDELYKARIIKWYSNSPTPIKLTDGLSIDYIIPMKRVADKVKTQNILPSKIYTPDFYIVWNRNHSKIHLFIDVLDDVNKSKFKAPFIALKNENYIITSYIETKGSFDNQNMTRLFKQNQAWIWDKHKIYINLTKIPNIFNSTFTPDRYRLTDKSMKPRKINYKSVISLTEFLNKN